MTRPADFEAVYEYGRKTHGKYVVCFAVARTAGRARIGITVSKRVGNAVLRNRTRRRIREWARHVYADLPPELDIVIVARPVAAQIESATLRQDLDRCLERIRREHNHVHA